ncbi:hypothetical protein NE237_002403 [Protea cynaroides]|uniref:Uncharacterized protein n=1 Tax=Protea cynaroides TaxID=273540 RepID=A0A9Q0KV75_9MAGN|nr:hypothetical protein NE237_002403 [Protea cynaroides]
MSLRLIKANMSRTIRRSIPDKPTAREYLDAIKEQYVSTDSSTVSTLIAKLGVIKYSESKDVRDHIMKARDIAAQLKDYEIDLAEVYLVHHILNTLTTKFETFKVTFNAQDRKWGGFGAGRCAAAIFLASDSMTLKGEKFIPFVADGATLGSMDAFFEGELMLPEEWRRNIYPHILLRRVNGGEAFTLICRCNHLPLIHAMLRAASLLLSPSPSSPAASLR